ncbi:response regulator [Paenibacillus senegalensis]|uniref:response regulator n=1 Tax=Paenibacillus senegalensis TaxID=1465766 RepID=UPI0002882943|nr:response regulator [Paenibacillus senegalensis]
MKIRTKLFIGFGALIFLMISLAGVGTSRLFTMDKNIDEIYQNRYTKVKLASNALSEVNNMNNQLVNLILNEPSNRREAVRDLNASLDNTQNYLQQLEERSVTAEEKRLIEDVSRIFREYIQYKEEAVELVELAQRVEASRLREEYGISLTGQLDGFLHQLVHYHEQRMDEEVFLSQDESRSALTFTLLISVVGLLAGIAIMTWLVRSITSGLSRVSRMITGYAKGLVDARELESDGKHDEIGEVAESFITLALDLEEKTLREQQMFQASEEEAWLKSNLARMTTKLQGIKELEKAYQAFVNELAPMIGGSYAIVYGIEEEEDRRVLISRGTYAYQAGLEVKHKLQLGEGLAGQCAASRESIHLEEVPPEYVKVSSGLGEIAPVSLLVYPISFEDEVVGVVEVASLSKFSTLQLELLNQLCENAGVVFNTILSYNRVEELLRSSQALQEELQVQSEELLSQQEELRASNERLEEKTRSLQRSEEMLQHQQEELEQANDELLKKTRELERQVEQTEQFNHQLRQTKAELERQALELAMTSKYKSEFLANMSHELRTPLNSLLILSQLLSDNKEGNLTDKQVEFATTIQSSGSDLLRIIDDILDLSKVEAGRMDVNLESYDIHGLKAYVKRNFEPLANKNEIAFEVTIAEDVPSSIYTDPHRLEQIIRNLLSNAFKFTAKGEIRLNVFATEEHPFREEAGNEGKMIAFSVKDTGIGIAEDKLDLIFQAFHQADGTTSRKYGGTGLGLSISQELARLLGGTITVNSVEGQGSEFILYLPENAREVELESVDLVRQVWREAAATAKQAKLSGPEPFLLTKQGAPETDWSDNQLDDDRDDLEPQDKVLLIIEDDENFARIIMDMGRSRGFKVLAALRGDQGLALAKQHKPDAIILDIQLPVVDGWSVLSRLKHNMETRHIPVHIMSVVDEPQQGLTMGALAYLQKPVSKASLENAFADLQAFLEQNQKKLLIVEDDDELRNSLVELIGHEDVQITAVSTGSAALEELRRQQYGCMVLDLGLSDISGFELLEQIREDEDMKDLPIIIYTGKELDKSDEIRLKKYAESIIIKNVKSPERLFDETALFLHRVEANLPEDKRKMLEDLHEKESSFSGKRILLVDDDIRNVFALSSVLESYKIKVTFAENGAEALRIMEESEPFDLILMDIMMPEMDGYEAMERIRENPEFERIPIIALTAKAMKEDRSKCIEAGASDYITKPINTDQLFSLLKVWLYN